MWAELDEMQKIEPHIVAREDAITAQVHHRAKYLVATSG